MALLSSLSCSDHDRCSLDILHIPKYEINQQTAKEKKLVPLKYVTFTTRQSIQRLKKKNIQEVSAGARLIQTSRLKLHQMRLFPLIPSLTTTRLRNVWLRSWKHDYQEKQKATQVRLSPGRRYSNCRQMVVWQETGGREAKVKKATPYTLQLQGQ